MLNVDTATPPPGGFTFAPATTVYYASHTHGFWLPAPLRVTRSRPHSSVDRMFASVLPFWLDATTTTYDVFAYPRFNLPRLTSCRPLPAVLPTATCSARRTGSYHHALVPHTQRILWRFASLGYWTILTVSGPRRPCRGSYPGDTCPEPPRIQFGCGTVRHRMRGSERTLLLPCPVLIHALLLRRCGYLPPDFAFKPCRCVGRAPRQFISSSGCYPVIYQRWLFVCRLGQFCLLVPPHGLDNALPAYIHHRTQLLRFACIPLW